MIALLIATVTIQVTITAASVIILTEIVVIAVAPDVQHRTAIIITAQTTPVVITAIISQVTIAVVTIDKLR